MKNCIIREAARACRGQVVYRTAAPTQAGNDMDWIECLVEDQSAGSSSLRCTSCQIARCAITEKIPKEKKRPLIHMLEQSNICSWVATEFHDAKECTMIHGVESVLDIQVQQDYRVLGVALILKKTLELEQLTLRAATFAEGLLCIFQ